MQFVDIRIINELEYDKMYALRHAVLRVPLGLNLYAQNFSTEQDYIKIGAFVQDNLVGCVLVEFLPNHIAKIRQMALDTNYHRLGIGGKLMLFAEQICVQYDIKTIVMHARLSAKLFYESAGYQAVGNEFLEVTIPHIIMQKKL